MLGRQTQSVSLDNDPFGGSIAGSAALHVALVVFVALYSLVLHHFRGSEWGNNQAPGAIQATLVSSAPAIPLPQETPPTPNVLATETPSPAPTPPQEMAKPEAPPPDAIPIPLKQTPPKPKVEAKKEAPPQPQKAKPQPIQQPSRHPQPVPNQQHRANYGEAASTQIPHSMSQNSGQESAVNTPGGDFGSRFPWYVAVINRKVKESWYTQEAGGTPPGRMAKVIFLVSRDGHPSSPRISQSSGSPTLDSSAIRAVQRVDTFGPLPGGYNGSSLSVEYTFTYSGASQ